MWSPPFVKGLFFWVRGSEFSESRTCGARICSFAKIRFPAFSTKTGRFRALPIIEVRGFRALPSGNLSSRNISSPRHGTSFIWRSGEVWSGEVWSGEVWSGEVWSGEVWSGEVWSGEVWSGEVWSGEVWGAWRSGVRSVEACFSVQCIFGNPLTLTQIHILSHCPPHILRHTFSATRSLGDTHSLPHIGATPNHSRVNAQAIPRMLTHTLPHIFPHILTHTLSSAHSHPRILIHTITFTRRLSTQSQPRLSTQSQPRNPPHNRVCASIQSQPHNMSMSPKLAEYTCDVSLKELRNMNTKEHDDSVPGRVERKLAKKEFVPDIWLPRFVKVRKEHSCVAVKDKNGVLLAFRIQVPAEFMNALNRSNADLPHGASSPGRRGEHVSRHYALWADFSRHPYMSVELLRDGEKANQWLKGNAPLFEYLGRHFFHEIFHEIFLEIFRAICHAISMRFSMSFSMCFYM